MYWINFLHIYQPPNQKPYWVKRVAAESYRKITAGLKKNKKAKITLNINACLGELLQKNGCHDVINDLRFLGNRGQIEFTGSAKYHPFLPLLPENEIIRQINLNYKTNRKILGPVYRPLGFFPPEMGYHKKIAKITKNLGYQWIIIDELGFNGYVNQFQKDVIYEIKGLRNFNVFFRERDTSFKILSATMFDAKMVTQELAPYLQKNKYLITAMDGETFGHHRPGLEKLLFDLYKLPKIKFINLSEAKNYFSKTKIIEPKNSSWAMMHEDIQRNTPYSRWFNKNNEIHIMQWQLSNLAISLVNKLNSKNSHYQKIRHELDRALHSDQYWWASAQPWWSLELIESGAKDLRDVIFSLPKIGLNIKNKAEKLYHNIVLTGFQWQKTDKLKNLAAEADEDVTQRMIKGVPKISAQEFNKIINGLKLQIKSAVNKEEYERAAQIRDRIKELAGKKKDLVKK